MNLVHCHNIQLNIRHSLYDHQTRQWLCADHTAHTQHQQHHSQLLLCMYQLGTLQSYISLNVDGKYMCGCSAHAVCDYVGRYVVSVCVVCWGVWHVAGVWWVWCVDVFVVRVQCTVQFIPVHDGPVP